MWAAGLVRSSRRRGRPVDDGGIRRALALAMPAALPVAMTGIFIVTRERLGKDRAYLASFGAYWIACASLSFALLGRKGVSELFREAEPRFGRPAILGATLLLWPPTGAIATRFVPELRAATPTTIATITGVAVVNSLVEELFWRGVFVTLWPADPWRGWVWPAVGFGAWHLAPQTVHRSSMGLAAYVASATALGLSWGWVAWRTRSLRWVSLSHLLTDGSGLRNAAYFLGSR
jgi:membrane protease YdiL (CAAX protease family)